MPVDALALEIAAFEHVPELLKPTAHAVAVQRAGDRLPLLGS